MSFVGYQQRKDSGHAWLGEIPDHWEIRQSRRLFIERKERARPDDEQLTASQKHGILTQKEFADREGQKVMQVITGLDILKHVEPNDFVISMRSFQGGLEHSIVRGCISSAYVMLIPVKYIESSFYKYLFKSSSYIRALQSTSNLVRDGQALRYDNFTQVPLPLPPREEQHVIAAFLDSETAKIDALVKEQRSLIALLQEKRQAVISHAVTKGLNPDARMKPSGIEWLGEVPALWSVAKFSRAVDFQEGPGIMAADFHDEGIPLMRVAGASGRWASLDGCNYLDPKKVAVRWNHFRLQLGDLIISGSATMGTVCEVGQEVVGAIAYTGLIRLRPVENETTRDFLRAFVHSSMFVTQIELLKAGATIQHFGPTHLRQVFMPVPPLNEQVAIAAHIDQVSSYYGDLIEQAELAIALFNERRAALISAAVTGKINVRDPAEIAPIPVDRTRIRGLVATEIIERSAHRTTFGRVKLQKIAYIAEAHTGVSELGGTYSREAAGPLDRDMISDMEGEASVLAGIQVDQAGGAGTAVTYKLSRQLGLHRRALAGLLGAYRTAKLDSLIRDFSTLDTRGAEAVATLYAVWNDALIDGEKLTDDEIIAAFLSDWHPEKAKKFRAYELHDWLGWMRRHDLVPTGSGPKTSMGRLFA